VLVVFCFFPLGNLFQGLPILKVSKASLKPNPGTTKADYI